MESAQDVTLAFLHDLFESLLEDPRISVRKGLKVPHLETDDQWRVFFTAKCSCEVSALLYLDVSKDKTADEVREAMPRLLDLLGKQTDQFLSMPCDLHAKMRMR
ncbi:MAG: hypothetical protein IIC82_03030 [Chloroflexi bacterium]|nr:hypothetical protein [Chloroflexota bacterium]